MRIGILAPPWVAVPPNAYGGTENLLAWLAEGLRDAGHDVLLFATTDSTCEVQLAATQASMPLENIGRIPAELRQVVDGYCALRECDVIHDHTLVGPLVRVADAHRWPPICTTAHGPFVEMLNSYYRCIAEATALIAISHHQASTAPCPVAAVIHHGLPVADVSWNEHPGKYLAFLGRMCEDKGPHRAIEIAQRVGLPLLIAAKMRDPEEVAYFEALVKPKLGTDVSYIGELDAKDKMNLLQDAYALLNPIAWPEPFGLVMIESLACGTPVVTAPFGAAPEIIDDGVTGFLCDDIDEYVAATAKVETLSRKACRMAVEERFGIERVAADHVRLYESMIERAAQRPTLI